jgi:hypothetical protein
MLASPMAKTPGPGFRKLHRNVGLVVVFFVVVIASTGIMLNHAGSLGLTSKAVPATIAGWYYEEDLSDVMGFSLPSGILYPMGRQVYLNELAVTDCLDGLRGAVELPELIVADCSGELLLISADGLLIERLSSVHGVPDHVESLGLQNNQLVLSLPGGDFQFDLNALSMTPANGAVTRTAMVVIPDTLTDGMLSGVVTWEKFILDVHSGRIVGIGTWLGDAIALLLIVMSLTGLLLARTGNRRGT